jgi:hypothetical protein
MGKARWPELAGRLETRSVAPEQSTMPDSTQLPGADRKMKGEMPMSTSTANHMLTERTAKVKGPPLTSSSLSLRDGTVCAWHTMPLFGGMSLEDDVSLGDGEEREQGQGAGLLPYAVGLTVNQVPAAVINTLWFLQGKAKGLSTVSAVSRYATRAGIRVLLRINVLTEIEEIRRKLYENGPGIDESLFTNRAWPGFRTLSADAEYRKLSLFGWVDVVVDKLAVLTGLPSSTVGLAATVAGLAQSCEWVPERYVELFAGRLVDFIRYLETRARLLY